jgi:integrase
MTDRSRRETPGVWKEGGRWKARARTGGRGSRRPKRTFDRKEDAITWKTMMDRQRQLGDAVDLGAGRVTLSEFVEVYWEQHAIPNLERSTRAAYKRSWSTHIKPRLGGYQLRELNPRVVNRFRVALLKAGKGDPTVRYALAVLQSILSLAVAEEHLRENPVAAIRKPSQAPARQHVAVPTAAVEAIRTQLLARQRAGRVTAGVRDATLVALLAYAGLRPQEALGLHWEDVGAKTLTIQWKVVAGELVPWTKTRKTRAVPLTASLAADLRAWRLACGRREGLVFVRADGEPWSDEDYRNWRTRVWQPAAAHAGIGQLERSVSYVTAATGQRRRRVRSRYVGATPYDLRATWVSLMVYEGHNIAEVARYAGHSVETLVRHYLVIFEEYDPAHRVSAEEQIAAARQALEADDRQLRLVEA